MADASKVKCLLMTKQLELEQDKIDDRVFKMDPESEESKEYFALRRAAAIQRIRNKKKEE
jgi:hypothetical protein